MKLKLFVFILAVTVLSWSQNSTQSNPAPSDMKNAQTTAPVDNKAECPCCQKMATDAKDSSGCCHHHAMSADKSDKPMSCCDGKDSASCCGGKDAKMCRKGDGDKTAKGCCSGTSCAEHAKGCVAEGKKGDAMAMACCAHQGHCPMHDAMHDHDINK